MTDTTNLTLTVVTEWATLMLAKWKFARATGMNISREEISKIELVRDTLDDLIGSREEAEAAENLRQAEAYDMRDTDKYSGSGAAR